VGRYGVDVEALDRVGVPAIRGAIQAGRLTIVDEIGKMELVSAAFRAAVEDALASPAPLLGAVMAASHPWADRIKAARGVTLIEVTVVNRDSLPGRLLDLVRKEVPP
jgi:nucleoside-triphosphatase